MQEIKPHNSPFLSRVITMVDFTPMFCRYLLYMTET